MRQFNQMDSLKRLCVGFATGLKGDLPKIFEEQK
jgi:hypothetical protein